MISLLAIFWGIYNEYSSQSNYRICNSTTNTHWICDSTNFMLIPVSTSELWKIFLSIIYIQEKIDEARLRNSELVKQNRKTYT